MSYTYVIGHVTVKDEEKWDEYRSKVPATLVPWGAELVLRGKLHSVLAGQHSHDATVVIRFADLEAVNNWYASDAYQSIIPIRELAVDIDLLVFEE